MKKFLLSVGAIMTAALLATTASANCRVGCPSTTTWSFEAGAGGQTINQGTALGNVGMVLSGSTKHVYAGGDANQYGADAYAGAHFATTGSALAASVGTGLVVAGTSELGAAEAGGLASVTGPRWRW